MAEAPIGIFKPNLISPQLTATNTAIYSSRWRYWLPESRICGTGTGFPDDVLGLYEHLSLILGFQFELN